MTTTITINNRRYAVEIEPDYDHGAPWDNDDGHGPVSDWTSRAKAPGEIVLNETGYRKRYYDFAEACRIARRDGWSTAEIEARKASGQRISKRQQATEAARADYERLRGWCKGYWQHAGVIVTGPDDEQASLWGVEDDASDYLAEVAEELAEELHAQWEKARRNACLLAYEG